MILTNGSQAPETVLATLTLTAPGTHLRATVEVPVVPATITPHGAVIDVRARIDRQALDHALDQLTANQHP